MAFAILGLLLGFSAIFNCTVCWRNLLSNLCFLIAAKLIQKDGINDNEQNTQEEYYDEDGEIKLKIKNKGFLSKYIGRKVDEDDE